MAHLGGDLSGGNAAEGFSSIPGTASDTQTEPGEVPQLLLPCLSYSDLGVSAKYLVGNPHRTGSEG